jgi:D-alanine-D-alanine ligase
MTASHTVSPTKIGVIMGGNAAERAASLNSGRALLAGFELAGYEAQPIEISAVSELLAQLQRSPVQLAYVALLGPSLLESRVRGLLDALGVAQLGSGVLASTLCADRLKAKELFRLHNLPVCPYYNMRVAEASQLRQVHGSFGYPAFVMPRRAAGAQNESLVLNFEQLQLALQRAGEHDDEILVERAVSGQRLGVGILDGRVLGALQRVDSEAGASEWQTPSLTATRYHGVLNLASRAATVLECQGAVSVELLVTEGGNEYVSEVNTSPSLAETTLFPLIAASAGYGMAELCAALVSGSRTPGSVLAPQGIDDATPSKLADRPLRKAG